MEYTAEERGVRVQIDIFLKNLNQFNMVLNMSFVQVVGSSFNKKP